MCPTIQDQVDNSTEFNENYLTVEYTTYVKAEGDIYNFTSPVWAYVNLTCYYDDSKAFSRINFQNFYPCASAMLTLLLET